MLACMWRWGIGISFLVMAACAHDRAVTRHDSPVATQASAPPATSSAAGDPAKPAVNKDLLKQGYRTAMRHGQLLYCRDQPITGTRFKSQVCMQEEQVLAEQRSARDYLMTPRPNECSGPHCAN